MKENKTKTYKTTLLSPPTNKPHVDSENSGKDETLSVSVQPSSVDDDEMNDFFSKLTSPRIEAWLKRIIGEAVQAQVSAQSKKIDDLEKKVTRLETELSQVKVSDFKAVENEKRIVQLENDLDELQQYGRRNALRFWSKDAETEGEDTDSIVLDHIKSLGVKMERFEIGRTHRVGKKRDGKPRAIIAKFISYRARQRVYDARKKNNNVFVSEDLTRKRAHIMYIARGMRRDKLIDSCWSKDGRIYVRELNAWGTATPGRVVQIHNKEDLNAFHK